LANDEKEKIGKEATVASTWRLKKPQSGQMVSRKIFEFPEKMFEEFSLRNQLKIKMLMKQTIYTFQDFYILRYNDIEPDNRRFGESMSPPSSGLKNSSSKKPV
jgi:hypothetical protein